MKINKLQSAKLPSNKNQKHSDKKADKKADKKKTKNKIKENKMINFADEDIENDSDEESLPKRRGAGPRFGPAEDAYIVKLALTADDVLSLDDLDIIASRCNKRFHNEHDVRTGDALWWRIRREQQRGNPVYQEVSIRGGSPKRTPGTRQTKGPVGPALIKSAMQPKLEFAPKNNQENVKKNKSSNNAVGLEIMVKNPVTGEIQKFITKKYSSIEELMFSLA